MKGAQRGGREGERYRGMEHKLSWKKRVQGLTNGCDWLAHWKDGGKSPARIITTRPVCQISAVICIRLLSIKWEPSEHQKGIFFMVRQILPGSSVQRNVSTQCIRIAGSNNTEGNCICEPLFALWKMAHILQQDLIQPDWKLAFRLWLFALQVMWNDSICHYFGCLAFIFNINIACKDCFLLA